LAHAESGKLSGNIDDRRVEKASRLATRSQQRLHFLQQQRVVGARLAQERLLRLSRQLLRRLPQIICKGIARKKPNTLTANSSEQLEEITQADYRNLCA
jgi:hypothetical protein